MKTEQANCPECKTEWHAGDNVHFERMVHTDGHLRTGIDGNVYCHSCDAVASMAFGYPFPAVGTFRGALLADFLRKERQ